MENRDEYMRQYMREYMREYRKKKKDVIAQNNKKWKDKNREHLKEYMRAYRKKQKELKLNLVEKKEVL